MKRYKVYMHENKINYKKYIGITCQKAEKRWSNGNGYKNNNHFFSAIKKYGWDTFNHYILFSDLTKAEAEQKEIELIEKYDTTNQRKGYNISTGGYAHTGCNHSKESKKLISQHNARPMLGKHLNDEIKRKLSEGRKGKNNPIHKHKFSDKERKAKSERMKKYYSNISNRRYGKDNHRSKKVAQYDLKGNLLKIYSATKEAERETNINCSSIIKVCKKQRKTAGGFVWIYIRKKVKK